MKLIRMKSTLDRYRALWNSGCGIVFMVLVFAIPAFSQTCFTSDDMDVLTRAALKAAGTAPLPRAEFLCGVFDANGQTADSAEFIIPNLPPGSYAVITLDVTTQKAPYTLSLVLQQQGSDWKVGGFFLRSTQVGGHDSNWFLDRARAFKAKGQTHNAWLYFIEGRELAVAVPFMSTQRTDKLYDEAQTVKAVDFPGDGNAADLTAPTGKTYKLVAIFPLASTQELDLVGKYQTADISDTGQTC